MHQEAPPRVDRILVMEVAAEAKADPRTVEKRLRHQVVRGMVGDRIDRVLVRRGLDMSEARIG